MQAAILGYAEGRTSMRLFMECFRIAVISVCTMLAAFWSFAAPPKGVAPDPCADWKLGQHEVSHEFQLDCIGRMERTGALRAVDSVQLQSEIDAFYTSVTNTGSRADAEILRILVNERELRKPSKGQQSPTIYSALLLSGQLEAARAERKYKKLDVPELPDNASMRPLLKTAPSDALSWTFVQGSQVMREVATHLNEGSRIVVYCSPDCGPCEQLTIDLIANQHLSDIFRRHSVWVDTPNAGFSRSSYEEWAEAKPMFPLHAVFKRDNWPQRTVPATPTLFFMKDGKVVHEMLGWTDENKVKLEQYIVELGLGRPE